MKKILVVFSIVAAIVILVSGISYAVSPEQQAQICAEENFREYLAVIEPDYVDFHFSKQEEVKQSELGNPISNVRIALSDLDIKSRLIEQAEPFAFYVFPVMVNGKPVTDFTVVLENGKWKAVDIGGRLSVIINELSKKEGLNSADSKILRFAGETFILVSKDGEEFGYLPFFDNLNINVKANELIPSAEFSRALSEVAKAKLQVEKPFINDDQLIFVGIYEAPSIQIKQSSVISRLGIYIRHHI